MHTTIIPRRTIIVCGECGYPRVIRKITSRYCPFCGSTNTDLNTQLDAKIVKIGALKEKFFRSLQNR